MLASAEYQHPSCWAETTLDGIDGLLLPGGHRARGMRSYIDSDVLHRLVVDAFARRKVVGAICHGVLLAARSVDPATGHSVLYGHRTTALTWALERTAWRLSRITRFWDPDYYRTYSEEPGQPSGYMSVQSEVTRALKNPTDFCDVDRGSPHYRIKTSGMARDTATDSRPAFVVDDGSLRVGALAGRHPHVRNRLVAEALTSARTDGWIGLGPTVFRFNQPRELFQPVDLLMQDVRRAGIFGINHIMHRAEGVDSRIDAVRDAVYDVRGALHDGWESRQASSGDNRVRPAVRHRVKRAHALGDGVAALAGEVDQLVELQM